MLNTAICLRLQYSETGAVLETARRRRHPRQCLSASEASPMIPNQALILWRMLTAAYGT
jgi:hypothetical protein